MSVLIQRDEDNKETSHSPLLTPTQKSTITNKLLNSQNNSTRSNKCTRPRDSLRLINEKTTSPDKEEVCVFCIIKIRMRIET